MKLSLTQFILIYNKICIIYCFLIPTYLKMELDNRNPDLIENNIPENTEIRNSSFVEPMEAAGEFEGDIVLPLPKDKNAARNTNLKWPGGVVPLSIDGNYENQGRMLLRMAVREFHKYTCIRFVRRTDHRDYVHILRGQGCTSMIGRQGGRQELSLHKDCDRLGTVIHEFMHALGFWHEQSRTDRDNYVTIRWENISPGNDHNFQKYDTNSIQTLGQAYDYHSVMHYPATAFSRNGRPTVEAKQPGGQSKIGQRKNFSWTDIKKINRLYNCHGYKM